MSDKRIYYHYVDMRIIELSFWCRRHHCHIYRTLGKEFGIYELLCVSCSAQTDLRGSWP